MGDEAVRSPRLSFRVGSGSVQAFRLQARQRQVAFVQIVAGSRVFCCDNLTLSGDLIVLKPKHTWGVHLGNRIILGLEKWGKTSLF
jgi:hypothetical protein